MRGKIEIQGLAARFLVSYPALSDDAVRGRSLCRASEQRLLDLLNEAFLRDHAPASCCVLNQIVGQVVQEASGFLNAENLLGRADLVIAVVSGNAIAVGSTADVTAWMQRRGRLLAIPSEKVDHATTNPNGWSAGTLVATGIEGHETFFAMAPGDSEWLTKGLNANDRTNGDHLFSPGRGVLLLARRLADAEDPKHRLLLGFGGTAKQPGETANNESHPPKRENASTPSRISKPKPATSAVDIQEDQVAAIGKRLDGIQDRIERLLADQADDHRAWQELLRDLREREQQDVDEHIMKPMLRRLILLHDSLSRSSSEGADRSVQTGKEDLLDLLATYGVEPYRSPGHRFDPKLQRCIRPQTTPTRTGDGMVAERVRDGFRQGDKILRYEEVTVWRFGSPQPPFMEREDSWQ